MSRCCTEPGCRRTTPIVLHRGPLSRVWFAVTRHTGATIHQKHELGPDDQRLLAAGYSALEHAPAWRAHADELERQGDTDGATLLRGCADQIDPPEETSST